MSHRNRLFAIHPRKTIEQSDSMREGIPNSRPFSLLNHTNFSTSLLFIRRGSLRQHHFDSLSLRAYILG
jgi:hypothetical protein